MLHTTRLIGSIGYKTALFGRFTTPRSSISTSQKLLVVMASNEAVNAPSSFTKEFVQAMQKLYPQSYADSSWDNTGLLVEAPPTTTEAKNAALLTIDLTRAVATEAIEKKVSVIMSYHPIIFSGLKSISTQNSQQESILRLIQAGISVYSPHTAVDAAPNGMNDWLADIVTAGFEDTHTREVIKPITGVDPSIAGQGRRVELQVPIPFDALLNKITTGIGQEFVYYAKPHTATLYSEIKSIAICPGSGGSLLKNVNADLLFTGELSHHEALAAIENGQFVVAARHSASERGYLAARMRELLLNELSGEPEILISEVDRDPYELYTAA